MKQLLTMGLLSLTLSFFSFSTQAQNASSDKAASTSISFTSSQKPKWVSEKGFWVVESNIHQPGKHTIYFYTNKKDLVYKETILDTKFKLNRRKTLMRIKKTLETVLIAREKGLPIGENDKFFVAAHKNK